MIAVLAAGQAVAAGRRLTLDPEEVRHLEVRRAREGDSVTVLDGAGVRGVGRLEREGSGYAVALERVASEPPPPPVTLAVGAGDRDRFALVAEQATQLGATLLIPVECERTRGVSTRLRESHLDRVRRRAREALKQSGALWAPVIDPPVPLEQLLAELGAGARWLADHGGGETPGLGPTEAVTILVGPEGGFTATERDQVLQAGFTAISLGPHILRFDTAALAALSTAWQARHRGAHG
jgi:16S rRNA (uracil1498-N3)-methyltransferase